VSQSEQLAFLVVGRPSAALVSTNFHLMVLGLVSAVTFGSDGSPHAKCRYVRYGAAFRGSARTLCDRTKPRMLSEVSRLQIVFDRYTFRTQAAALTSIFFAGF